MQVSELDKNAVNDETIWVPLVKEYDNNNDGKLSEDELAEIKELDIAPDCESESIDWVRNLVNLSTIIIENENIKELDLSQSKALQSIDLNEASHLETLKLPELDNYDGLELPDNEGLEIVFPENSQYEEKWVLSKVEEVAANNYSDDMYTMIYKQSVESATKISDLSIVRPRIDGIDSDNTETFSFVYDDLGRIESSDIFLSGNYLTYNNQNKASEIYYGTKTNENASEKKQSDGVEYLDSGEVSKISPVGSGDLIFTYEGDTITCREPSGEVDYIWKRDNGKTTSYTYGSTSKASYVQHDYTYDNNSLCMQEKITVFTDYGMLSSDEPLDNTRTDWVTYIISYTYDDNQNRITATFDNGFTYSYEYNDRGLLKEITSSGEPIMDGDFSCIKSCDIEYKRVIAKKDQTPLSFITLPGKSQSGTVHQKTAIRYILFRPWAWDDCDFTGKFWWDEENIINNQVEAAQSAL